FADLHQRRKCFLHGINVRIDFRRLQHDGAIDILYSPAAVVKHLRYLSQEKLAVHPFPSSVGVVEVIADIPQIGSPQQRITNGMNEHISIRMSCRTPHSGKFDSTKEKVFSFFKHVHIVTESYADFHFDSAGMLISCRSWRYNT